MTIQEVKNWLHRYKHLQSEIEDIELKLKQLRQQYGSPSAINYSDMPKVHNPHDLSDFYAKLEELETMLIDRHTKALGVAVQIYQAVDSITDPDEKHVIRRRYLDCAHWQEIADEIPCSLRNVYCIRDRALLNLSETLH